LILMFIYPYTRVDRVLFILKRFQDIKDALVHPEYPLVTETISTIHDKERIALPTNKTSYAMQVLSRVNCQRTRGARWDL